MLISSYPRAASDGCAVRELDVVQGGQARAIALIRSCARDAGPLAPALEHALAASGKRLRPRLTLTFAIVKQARPSVSDDVVKAAAAVELLHEASLIHDDICDASVLRRNRPSVPAAFGVRRAGWAGLYLASKALELLASIDRLRAERFDFSAMRRLAEGQLLEMLGAGQGLEELREHYERVVLAKTGALFELACTLGAQLVGAGAEELEAIRGFARHWSIGFQALDDVRDIEAPEDLGKPWGSDVRGGIATWPLLEWAAAEGVERLCAAIEGRSDLSGLRRELLASGATARARTFALGHFERARTKLDVFAGEPGYARLLALAEEVLRL